MKKFFAIVLLLGIAVSLYYAHYSPLYISEKEAKERIAKGDFPIVLDVRSDLEYSLGHYPEAVHIPITKLEAELDTKLPRKTTGILVYCNTGQRSRYAADILKSKGYKNVRYISGPYWSLLR